MNNKIQTGLRIPEKIHTDLQNRASQMGVSVNQLVLILINIGIKFLDEGVIPQSDKE